MSRKKSSRPSKEQHALEQECQWCGEEHPLGTFQLPQGLVPAQDCKNCRVCNHCKMRKDDQGVLRAGCPLCRNDDQALRIWRDITAGQAYVAERQVTTGKRITRSRSVAAAAAAAAAVQELEEGASPARTKRAGPRPERKRNTNRLEQLNADDGKEAAAALLTDPGSPQPAPLSQPRSSSHSPDAVLSSSLGSSTAFNEDNAASLAAQMSLQAHLPASPAPPKPAQPHACPHSNELPQGPNVAPRDPPPAVDPLLQRIAEHPPLIRELWDLSPDWARAVKYHAVKYNSAEEKKDEKLLDQAILNLLLLPGRVLAVRRDLKTKAWVANQLRREVDPNAPELQPDEIKRQPRPPLRPAVTERDSRVRWLIQKGKLVDAIKLLLDWKECADPEQPDVREELQRLHPASEDDQLPPLPDIAEEDFVHVTEDDLKRLLREACRRHSSGGPSGWTYHYMKAAMTEEAVRKCFLSLIRRILTDTLPPQARKLLLACRLVPFKKPQGGLRPIAVGEVFARIASALAVRHVMQHAQEVLGPFQLGIGVKGGVEAAAHILQEALLHPDTTLLSLDIENAFNTLSRSFMLSQLFKIPKFASIYRIVYWAYSTSSDLLVLKNGKLLYSISSSRGVRQGDPLGTLLFCIALIAILIKIAVALSGSPDLVAVVDDINLIAQNAESLARAYAVAKQELRPAGLRLQPTKVKLIPSGNIHPTLAALARQEQWQIVTDATVLLGAPIGTDKEGIERLALEAVERHRTLFETLEDSQILTTQEALLIFRLCATPRVNYLLRVLYPDHAKEAAERFDTMQRHALETFLAQRHGTLEERVWKQACLPLKLGGLGIQSASALLQEAWFSSQALAAQHVEQRFRQASAERKAALEQAYAHIKALDPNSPLWREELGRFPGDATQLIPCEGSLSFFASYPSKAAALQQRIARIRHLGNYNRWLEEAKSAVKTASTPAERQKALINLARIRAVSAKKASLWLSTFPSRPDLRYDNHTAVVGLHSRFGIKLPDQFESSCPCSPDGPADLDVDPFHWLEDCRYTFAARNQRHDSIKQLECSWMSELGAIVKMEPRRLGEDNKRPDAFVQLGAETLLLDFAVVNPLCKSYLQLAAQEQLGAAKRVAKQKREKYKAMAQRAKATFIPVIIEATGGFHSEALELIQHIKRATRGNGSWKPSEVVHGLERSISVAVMRGNAAMVQCARARLRRSWLDRLA